MKVVLFCGGYGMRMRGGSGASEEIPKPMQMVGPRPLLWHVMRYYAHFGHTEFLLCLGHGAQQIKDYFLAYQETGSNDFIMHDGQVQLLSTDISSWTITFVDTGVASPIGERLRRVRRYLGEEEVFLANYADVLSDAPLNVMIEKFRTCGAAAALMAVPPQSSFHCVEIGEGGLVSGIVPVSKLPLWENGGFFILTPEVFDYLPPGGDLVEDACTTLAKQGRLMAFPFHGYWKPADTFKERAELDAAWHSGDRPWMLWASPDSEPAPYPVSPGMDRA